MDEDHIRTNFIQLRSMGHADHVSCGCGPRPSQAVQSGQAGKDYFAASKEFLRQNAKRFSRPILGRSAEV